MKQLVALLLLSAAVAMPAHAAADTKPVAVASDGGVELLVSDDDDLLCLGIKPPSRTPFTVCQEAKNFVGTAESGSTTYLVAAVARSAASVEVRRAGRPVGSALTVAGEAYTGREAGKMRFVLVRLAPQTPDDGLRVHTSDGAGKLVEVLTSNTDELVLDRRRLFRGRSGRVAWTMVAQRSSVLEPSVVDLARETISRCVEVKLRAATSASLDFGQAICTDEGPRGSFAVTTDVVQVQVLERCDADFRLVYGMVANDVRRVTVVLGDGRRRSAPIVSLRDIPRRAYAIAIAPGDAIRAVTLHPASGRPLSVPRALAPLPVACAARGEAFDFPQISLEQVKDVPPLTPAGPVTTIAGSPVVRVADGSADTLCVASGDRPFTALGCSVVSPTFDDLPGALNRLLTTGEFVLAVPAEVATVRLTSADRRAARSIPTVAGDGYAGRYAGFVRFVAASGAGIRELPRVELLDAAGKILHEADEKLFGTRRLVSARRVAGRMGSPSLWRTTLRDSDGTRRCLALTAGPRPSADDVCQATASSATALLHASCVTRRLTVAVSVRSGTRVLADVGTATPRRLRLRNGVGLLTLPASRPLRALTFIRRGRARRVRLQAPPGARQCGWSAAWTGLLG